MPSSNRHEGPPKFIQKFQEEIKTGATIIEVVCAITSITLCASQAHCWIFMSVFKIISWLYIVTNGYHISGLATKTEMLGVSWPRIFWVAPTDKALAGC